MWVAARLLVTLGVMGFATTAVQAYATMTNLTIEISWPTDYNFTEPPLKTCPEPCPTVKFIPLRYNEGPCAPPLVLDSTGHCVRPECQADEYRVVAPNGSYLCTPCTQCRTAAVLACTRVTDTVCESNADHTRTAVISGVCYAAAVCIMFMVAADVLQRRNPSPVSK